MPSVRGYALPGHCFEDLKACCDAELPGWRLQFTLGYDVDAGELVSKGATFAQENQLSGMCKAFRWVKRRACSLPMLLVGDRVVGEVH